MQQRCVAWLTAVIVLAWLTALPVLAEKRVALVIGINDYRDVPPLQKAVGDATAMASALTNVGFTVTTVTNAGRRDLNRSLADLEKALSPGDTALVHFSGHGVEIDGQNYFLPADIPQPQSGDRNFLKEEAISLASILERLDATGAATRILIIDACRDNPFAATGTRGIGSERGLARVEAPKGTFILYSAGYGQRALDRLNDADPAPTSVFARVLLKHLTQAGREITDIAKDVRTEVAALADGMGHEQRPAYYDELTGRFYLVPPAEGAAAGQPPPQSSSPPPADAVATDFALAKDVGTAEAWDAFLARHGSLTGNFHVDLARAARQKLASVPTQHSPPAPAEKATHPPTVPTSTPAGDDAEAALTKQQRMEIEVALMQQQADPGDIDGDFDSDARAGIKSWQYISGFQPTGKLDRPQIDKLLGPSAGKRKDLGKIAMAYSQAPDGSDARLDRAIGELRGYSLLHTTFDGHLYLAVLAPDGIMFHDARELAERAGGTLACVSSATENKAIFELIEDDPRFWRTGTDDFVSGPWLGLHQAPGSRSSGKGWVWVDGCKSKYRNWKGGQPNEISLGAGPGAAAFGGNSDRRPTPAWQDAIMLKQDAPGLIIEIE